MSASCIFSLSLLKGVYNSNFLFRISAPFFQDCISEADLDEMNVELIRNTLYKAYLEAFYDFCRDLGGETADVMCEILAVSSHRYYAYV